MPSSGLGSLGDLYEDLTDGDLYEKQSVFTAPPFRSAAFLDGSASSLGINVPMPAGAVSGDVLLMGIVGLKAGSAPVVTVPAGWTRRDDETVGARAYVFFTKVADGTEGSTVAVTFDGTTIASGCIIAYADCTIDAFAAFGSSQATTTPTVPSVTSTAANCQNVGVVFGTIGASGTPATGFTERVDHFNVNDNSFFYAMDRTLAAAGASGTSTPTMSGSFINFTEALSLKANSSVPTWVLIRSGNTVPPGLDGMPGAVGATGATGVTGAMGPDGLPGLDGTTGATGVGGAGVTGATGVTGPAGLDGIDGLQGPAGSGALTLLSTTTLGATGSIDVSGISGAYNDLILVLFVRCAVAVATDSDLRLRLNGDTGPNYTYQYVRTNSAGTPLGTTFDAADMIAMGAFPGDSATAGAFSAYEIILPGYASTTWWKSCLFQGGNNTNITSNTHNTTNGNGLWKSTAAITQVTIDSFVQGANLKTGSVLRIYGRL